MVVAVGSDEDGANSGDAGHVWGNQLFPKLFAARGQVQPVDRGGNFAKAINKQRATVAGPRDRGFSSAEGGNRSEEHTSELQSQSNLVCRLLLEKKKNKSFSICARVTHIFSFAAS